MTKFKVKKAQQDVEAPGPDPDRPRKAKHEDEEEELDDQDNRLPPVRVALVFFALGMAVLLATLEASIIATALSTISTELTAGSVSAWIATSYMLTQCAICPLWSRLSDITGRKPLLLFCMVEFVIASLACAVARNAIQLIVFRAFQGVGGGALLILAQAICIDVVSLKERSKYQVIFEVMMTLGNAVGPILGGVFAGSDWRWCFWINLPLGAVALVMIYFLLPAKKVSGNWRQKAAKVDVGGSLLVIVASVLTLLALSWGGVVYQWQSGIVLSLLLIGVAVGAAFCVYEAKAARLPIVPMRLFRLGNVNAVMLLSFLSTGMNIGFVVFYIPQYLQLVKGFSAIRSGLFLLPVLLPITFVVFICSMITVRTGRYVEPIFFGLSSNAVALGILATFDEDTSTAKIIGFLFLAGVTVGPTFQTALLAAQAAVRKHDLTVVTGTRIFMRQIGNMFGVAVGSTLINNRVTATGLPSALVHEILEKPALLNSGYFGIDAATIDVVKGAYVSGFKSIFLAAAICSAISFVVAVALIRHIDLDASEAIAAPAIELADAALEPEAAKSKR